MQLIEMLSLRGVTCGNGSALNISICKLVCQMLSKLHPSQLSESSSFWTWTHDGERRALEHYEHLEDPLFLGSAS